MYLYVSMYACIYIHIDIYSAWLTEGVADADCAF